VDLACCARPSHGEATEAPTRIAYGVIVGSPTNALGVEIEGAMNLL